MTRILVCFCFAVAASSAMAQYSGQRGYQNGGYGAFQQDQAQDQYRREAQMRENAEREARQRAAAIEAERREARSREYLGTGTPQLGR